jgi:two-component system, NtrC family, nitrogen regulation sensor histidine kinase NtrY
VRAVARLNATPPLLLMIGRPVDPQILGYMTRTEQAVSEYQRLDESRSWLQIAFAWIFAVVALMVLLAAALIGLVIANQIARPVGTLINATERVRGGDLGVRVAEGQTRDELAGLSRAFNRMTGQLASQRAELMEAYSQIDGRRRFTETVLAGVSAGVIGLDEMGRIELPNRAAADLIGVDLQAAIGRDLGSAVPEFAPLVEAARAAPERPRTEEVRIGPINRPRTLLARIGSEISGGRVSGFVVTFDDITELQLAQRKAAWADVARRIAHEIKNPLTPIQLAAERLKRRFTKEITSDPDTFGQCADTIIRHVGDIGRMVDEFSAFARMPQPVIKREDVGLIARETLVLQRTALHGINWTSDIPARGPHAFCDRRMMRQAITNLLRNAADAVAMREGAGAISVSVGESNGLVSVQVSDDGIGLPSEDRARLTEPYVTHKPKGTGLGLAIVKKIMEDHGGQVTLDDRPDGPGCVATLVLPVKQDGVAQEAVAPGEQGVAQSPEMAPLTRVSAVSDPVTTARPDASAPEIAPLAHAYAASDLLTPSRPVASAPESAPLTHAYDASDLVTTARPGASAPGIAPLAHASLASDPMTPAQPGTPVSPEIAPEIPPPVSPPAEPSTPPEIRPPAEAPPNPGTPPPEISPPAEPPPEIAPPPEIEPRRTPHGA